MILWCLAMIQVHTNTLTFVFPFYFYLSQKQLPYSLHYTHHTVQSLPVAVWNGELDSETETETRRPRNGTGKVNTHTYKQTWKRDQVLPTVFPVQFWQRRWWWWWWKWEWWGQSKYYSKQKWEKEKNQMKSELTMCVTIAPVSRSHRHTQTWLFFCLTWPIELNWLFPNLLVLLLLLQN